MGKNKSKAKEVGGPILKEFLAEHNKHNATYYQVAKACGLDEGIVGKYFKGTTTANWYDFLKICKYLGVKAKDIKELLDKIEL